MALAEFVRFHDRVYEYRAARWPAAQRRQLHILSGRAPYEGRLETRCFVARDAGMIIARAAAVIDRRYNCALERSGRTSRDVRGDAAQR